MFEYILFAHNDIETRSIFYEILSNLGYKVTTVISHKDVLEILKNERPEYIILDPAISDMPVEAVLEKIRLIDENIKAIVLERNKNKLEITQDIVKILREKQVTTSLGEETKGVQLKADILVVDDEEEPVQLVKNYLSKKGYKVDIALSGEEALFKINTAQPDVVFLDIRMTGMDGIVTLKNIKNIDKSITVIMTTAVGDDEIVKKAMELGANGYLIKPFNLNKLEAAILSNTLQKYL